jgi:hypothetical protein
LPADSKPLARTRRAIEELTRAVAECEVKDLHVADGVFEAKYS